MGFGGFGCLDQIILGKRSWRDCFFGKNRWKWSVGRWFGFGDQLFDVVQTLFALVVGFVDDGFGGLGGNG